MHCLLGNYFVFKNMNQFHEKNYVWNNNVVDKNPDTDSLDVVPFRNLKKMFGFKETWNKLTCQKRRYLQKNRRSSSKIWCQKINSYHFHSAVFPFLLVHILFWNKNTQINYVPQLYNLKNIVLSEKLQSDFFTDTDLTIISCLLFTTIVRRYSRFPVLN